MAIEGRSDARARPHPARHGRRRRRAPSSARCTASPRAWTTSTNWSPARCRPTPREGARFGADLGLAPDRIYGDFEAMAQGRGGAAGRHRGGRHRHAEPPARAGRPSAFLEGRHPRHLRQAADDDAGRGAKTLRELAQQQRARLRAHPQLHRLSDGPPGARRWSQPASSARSASCRSSTRRTG